MFGQPRELVRGIGFTEGPVWTSTGQLLVTSVNRGIVYRVNTDPGTGANAHVVVETGGGPNGLAEGPDGSIWITQNGGQLLRTTSTLPTQPSIQRWTGGDAAPVFARGFSCPSDCVLGPDGRLWFTDPVSTAASAGVGAVRALDIDTGESEELASGLGFPNGLALSTDAEELYVAESHSGGIRRFRVKDGSIVAVDVLFQLPHGNPDGVVADRDGRIYITAPGDDSVYVVSRAGKLLERLELGPSFPTNITFYGADQNLLAITAAKGGRVVSVETRVGDASFR